MLYKREVWHPDQKGITFQSCLIGAGEAKPVFATLFRSGPKEGQTYSEVCRSQLLHAWIENDRDNLKIEGDQLCE